MNYSPKEILSFVEENDVKFIRLRYLRTIKKYCDYAGSAFICV